MTHRPRQAALAERPMRYVAAWVCRSPRSGQAIWCGTAARRSGRGGANVGYPFLWAPPTETDDQGRYSLNGRDWIKAGIPIHTAETREEAVQWQAERKRA